jgi:ATP/maltotriose-dependent transcriptional regulator MalT
VLYQQVGDVDGALMMVSSRASMADTASEAFSRFDACVGEARAVGATHPLQMVLVGRAGILLLLGEFVAAEASVREAQKVQPVARVPFWSLDRRNLRALVCIERGRLRHAVALCCRTLAGRGRSAPDAEALGDAATVAMAALARVGYLGEDDAAAVAWAGRALDHHRRRHGPAASYDLALYTLVQTSIRQDDLDAARHWLEAFGRGPEPRWYAGGLTASAMSVAATVCRAEIALACGDDGAATAAVHSALTRARREELLAVGLAALVPMARILERRGAQARAQRLAGFLCRHPRASFETRRAAALLDGAESACEPTGRDEGAAGVLAALDQAIADL